MQMGSLSPEGAGSEKDTGVGVGTLPPTGTTWTTHCTLGTCDEGSGACADHPEGGIKRGWHI